MGGATTEQQQLVGSAGAAQWEVPAKQRKPPAARGTHPRSTKMTRHHHPAQPTSAEDDSLGKAAAFWY